MTLKDKPTHRLLVDIRKRLCLPMGLLAWFFLCIPCLTEESQTWLAKHSILLLRLTWLIFTFCLLSASSRFKILLTRYPADEKNPRITKAQPSVRESRNTNRKIASPMIRTWFSVSVIAFILFVVSATLTMGPSPHAGSPDNTIIIRSTCFQGSKPHPLDETLRLIVSTNGITSRTIQTSIPYSRRLSIKWIDAQPAPFFVVEKRHHPLMKFLVDETGPRCIEGRNYLADDPYKLEPSPRTP